MQVNHSKEKGHQVKLLIVMFPFEQLSIRWNQYI